MKKFSILIGAILISGTLCYAAGDFIQFGYPYDMAYRNGMNREIEDTIDMMNRTNSWENPYNVESKNPISSFFKRNKNPDDKYSKGKMDESDMEYLLSKMEDKRFGVTYSGLDIENRLDRLDSQVFGAIQSGDYKTRLNRLKHAFSAEATRSYKAKNNKVKAFKEMFSSGYPTSIPAHPDYYSALDNFFW